MTDQIIDLFTRYIDLFRRVDDSFGPQHEDLSHEAIERMRQLLFLCTELDKADNLFRFQLIQEVTNNNGDKEYYNPNIAFENEIKFIIRMYSESSYYFAFRLRQLLRNTDYPFTGFGGFECVKVRNVRNHLIEHPEGSSSKIFNRTYSWTLETGMCLKTGRQEWESDSFTDEGFKINMDEFDNKLLSTTEKAIEQLKEREHG